MSQTLSRQTLSDQIVELLIAHIQENHLQSGDHLPSESKLAERYNVSRPIVREAMKILSGKGLVDISSGRRAVIKPVSGDMLNSFFSLALRIDCDSVNRVMEVRRALEVENVRLAHARITESQYTQLVQITAKMGKFLHDYDRFSELDWEFHLLLAQSTQNEIMFFMLESIRDTVKRVIREGLNLRVNTAEIREVQRQHEQIVEALKQEETQAVVQAMMMHFDTAMEKFNERCKSA
jgi:GntR family transcriptional repressor for pyruvate dehydrogenase complex